MSERKVLSKYYPPDFDPAAVGRRRGPKQLGPKVQTVRVAAPFSMRCTSCGEYVYKGRKFNARKETPLDEKYLGIQIYRFYIRCTRCSAEITYKTDPKNNDYAMERGAKRNTEPWRQKELADETDEQRLDRLEREMLEEQEEAERLEAAELQERNAMTELDNRTAEREQDMKVADALDRILARTDRRERLAKAGGGDTADLALPAIDAAAEEAQRTQDKEDQEYMAAVRARARASAATRTSEDIDRNAEQNTMPPPSAPPAEFILRKKRQLDGPQMPALKLLKKDTTPTATLSTSATTFANAPLPPKRGPLVSYGSDSDDEWTRQGCLHNMTSTYSLASPRSFILVKNLNFFSFWAIKTFFRFLHLAFTWRPG